MTGSLARSLKCSMARSLKPGILVPSNVYPSNLATYDLNFAAASFFGGTQPLGDNLNDGRFLRQQITNTQPNFIENADGTLTQRNVTQEVRYGTRGLALAGDRQNRIIQNRDLTNAAWVKTNCTALKNQTGRTGVANSASLLTATAANATCLQSITVTSLLLRGYVDVKRVTGSGTIEMTMDNGVTWTVLSLTPTINNGIARASIPTQTLANPIVGFRIATSGDAFLLDLAELSDGGEVEYEPVPTTSASVKNWRDRAAAYTTDAGPLGPWFLNQTTQVMYFEYSQRQNGSLIASDADLQISSNSSLGVSISIGSGGASTIATANMPNFSADARLSTINKVMMYRTPSASAICLNGGVVAKGGGFTHDGLGTHWDFGTNGAGNLHIRGAIKRCWFGSIIPPDAFMQSATT